MKYSSRDLIGYLDLLAYESARNGERELKSSDFIMRYSKNARRVLAFWVGLALLLGIGFHIAAPFSDLLPLAMICYAVSLLFLLSYLYKLSYQCHVTQQRIVQIQFWIFKKELPWSAVKAKKARKDKSVSLREYRTPTLVLYQDDNKKAFYFFDEMVGFTQLQRMIKNKSIPTKKKNRR